MREENVVDFYRKNWPLLVKLWQVDKTYCIHHGYYEKGKRTHIQSVENMNNFVGQLLCLDSKEKQTKKILDAGCGIGGTITYLAKKYPNVNFTGITIIPEHVEIAKALAKEKQVDYNTNFLLGDFNNTSFSSNQFDAVFSIESISYAPLKDTIIQEMYRILKPRGLLVIVDGFRNNVQLSRFFINIYKWLCKSWGQPNFVPLEEFKDTLKKNGFQEIEIRDITKNIISTLLWVDILSIPYLSLIAINKILRGKSHHIDEDPRFPATAPVLSTIIGIKKGMTYNVVTAIKQE